MEYIDGIEEFINNKIKPIGLYPLFYNLIANVILDVANILLHSTVLYYNNLGILVVGDFHFKKTTLFLKARKKNIEVVSVYMAF